MKKALFRIYRHGILKGVAFWYARWGEHSFLAVLAVLIGAVAAVAAAVLHSSVEYLEKMVIDLSERARAFHQYGYLAVIALLPLVGMSASLFVQRRWGGPRYAKSLSPLILALSRKRTAIPFRETFLHMLSSALSVGFGGSAGLEAPSVLTGAAIGSTGASFFKVDQRKRSLLLGCGSSAAISAIFGSPIAGVLFSAEVLLPEFSVSALVPMIIASAVAAVMSRLFIPQDSLFPPVTGDWQTHAVPCYFLCAIACALVGVYVIKAAHRISSSLKTRFRTPWLRLLAGGSLLCLILLFFPVLRGQGYFFIGAIFDGKIETIIAHAPLLAWLPEHDAVLLLLLTAIILLKVVASVLTVDAGGDGGIFAPSMFVGAFTGFAFARLVNLTGLIELKEINFALVGMCGVFTAVMRAPLTGIFLIAEVTGGYILLVPLMIVSAVSYFTARFFEPYSIYRKPLAESNLLNDDRDQSMLKRLPVRLNLSRDYQPLRAEDRLQEVINLVERRPADTFPVLDQTGRLQGVVYLEKILKAMLNPDIYNHLLVFDLMEEPCAVMHPEDDLARAMAAFDQYRIRQLPVCDNDNTFLGLLDKSGIFAKYRSMIRDEPL